MIHGPITSLPPDGPAAAVPDPAALLSHYPSTAASRRDFACQIESPRRRSPALSILYPQLAGKQHGKSLKASLKAKGITRGHLAVLEDTILRGAVEKKTAAAMAGQLAPPSLLDGLVRIRI